MRTPNLNQGDSMPLATDAWRTVRARPADDARADTADGRVTLTDDAGRKVLHLDELGATIWANLDGHRPLSTILDQLPLPPDMTSDEVADHLVTFIETLRAHELISQPTFDSSALPPEVGSDSTGITFDFILKPHPMAADPTGRPTSLDVLMAVNEPGSADHRAWTRIVDAIRSRVGENRSVWGVKLHEGRISYELYFCHHQYPPTEDLQPFFDEIVAAFGGISDWSAPVDLPPSTGMVSFEFDIDDDGGIHGPSTIETYQPSEPTENVWVNYRLGNGAHELRNTYQTHDLPEDEAGLATWIACSRFSTPTHPLAGAHDWIGRISGLRECIGTWCARKPAADGMYLRRVHPEDLAAFLDTYAYPPRIRTFVHENTAALDHLRFEVSFDYTVDNDDVDVHKTGFYGYF